MTLDRSKSIAGFRRFAAFENLMRMAKGIRTEIRCSLMIDQIARQVRTSGSSSPASIPAGPPAPAGEDQAHHIFRCYLVGLRLNAHGKPASTGAYVYNQGCKHFCACKTAVTPADSRSKPVSSQLIFSFTTRPGMQEIPRRRRSR